MTVTDPTARRLDLLLGQEQVAGRLPSVVAAVVRDGSVVWTGQAGTVGGAAPDADTQYRIGSITKTLVAVALLQLRDELVLDVNDRLERHLPGVPYGDRTLRELLAHSSGMHSEPAGSWWERSPGVGFEQLVAALDDTDPAFPPGRTFHYTNVAFALLGEVVARHRGRPWFEVVQERILEPLGMARTSYLPQSPHATGWSVHHYASTLTEEPAHDAGAMAPAGQVWSTVADLARYAAFLVAGHDGVLSRSTLEEMSTPQSAARAARMSSAHGLGFQVVQAGSGLVFGHTGSMPGFVGGIFVDPVRRTGAAVLCNATSGLRAEGFPVQLLETVEELEGTLPAPWAPVTSVPPAVEEVLGVWHWGNTAFAFSWDGSELVVGKPGRPVAHRFRPTDDGSFLGTVGYHHGERLQAVRDPDGRLNHLVCATFVYTRIPYDPAAPIPGR